MKKAKIGFLPLYIKLYDDAAPAMRPGVEAYLADLWKTMENAGVELVKTEICRIAPEFEAAVAKFEQEKVDAIVTVHMAYCPSLECIDALAATKLPILIMDTTRDFNCGFDMANDAVSYCHGIHGVQDMCNLLRRRGKDYTIFTGHYEKSDVAVRVADAARAIKAANSLNGMKVGRIGGAFEGMGDFVPAEGAMERLGITAIACDGTELSALRDSVTEEELRAEYEKDCAENGASAISYEDYKPTERIGLGIRKWIEKHELGAFTMTFLSAGKVDGFDTMPFAESCKAMARGLGYAGEGDVLTAALVGALSTTFDKVNFTEMFCPDWQRDSVYMSHMGESNLNLLESKKTVILDFPYADSPDPTRILGNMVAGKACIVNVLPNAEGWFDMVICDGEMLQCPPVVKPRANSMNGWFKPQTSVAEFLEKYSELGGTHHSALVYGVSAKSLTLFAKTLGMKVTVI